jgi:hypothetical protein
VVASGRKLAEASHGVAGDLEAAAFVRPRRSRTAAGVWLGRSQEPLCHMHVT